MFKRFCYNIGFMLLLSTWITCHLNFTQKTFMIDLFIFKLKNVLCKIILNNKFSLIKSDEIYLMIRIMIKKLKFNKKHVATNYCKTEIFLLNIKTKLSTKYDLRKLIYSYDLKHKWLFKNTWFKIAYMLIMFSLGWYLTQFLNVSQKNLLFL